MKGPPIDQLVFNYMFPRPRQNEPTNFHGFLQKHLVNEVRAETTAFYGSLDSRESQYPGLNYSYPPHRVRLSRYTWHRRLFRAFDGLGLTKHEIAELTKWEGTIWAKERFEKEQGIIIRDTTGDTIGEWVPPHLRVHQSPAQPQEAEVEEMEDVDEEEESEVDDEDDDSDMDIDSVGVELNRRLLTTATQRESGTGNEILDEEFEEWLKQAVEEGGLPGLLSSEDESVSTITSSLPPRLLNAARLGQWQQFPEALRSMVRAEFVGSSGTTDASVTRPSRRQVERLAPTRSVPRMADSSRPMRAMRTATDHTGSNSILHPPRD